MKSSQAIAELKDHYIKENSALSKAYDYIVDTRIKQGRFLDASKLYGDGSRFLPLSLKGFELMLNNIKAMVRE